MGGGVQGGPKTFVRFALPLISSSADQGECPPASTSASELQQRLPKRAAPSAEDRVMLARARELARSGRFIYNNGRIIMDPRDGSVTFNDLTMRMVSRALLLARDPVQRARLAELRTNWAGGKDTTAQTPSYVALVESGDLDRRIEEMKAIRAQDRWGIFKRAGAKSLKIGGYNLNVGEEREISGLQGSGTIYFSHCSMKCSFCQYGDIAQMDGGVEQSPATLAKIMLALQESGAHNIQLMTPSHYLVEILLALKLAAGAGLAIPLVYNTGGMEDLDALRTLEGIIDIYLPDFKFGTNAAGRRYGQVEGYVDNTKLAITEMWRQVGHLATDDRGIAYRGVLVRHLVMPGDVAHADEVIAHLGSISPSFRVNVLDHWAPAHRAFQLPEINRKVTAEEFTSTREKFRKAGFEIESRRPCES